MPRKGRVGSKLGGLADWCCWEGDKWHVTAGTMLLFITFYFAMYLKRKKGLRSFFAVLLGLRGEWRKHLFFFFLNFPKWENAGN